jgi:hypothetical protein
VSLIEAHQEPGKQDNQQDNQHNIGTFSSAATRRLVGLANVPRYFLAMDSAVTAFIACSRALRLSEQSLASKARIGHFPGPKSNDLLRSSTKWSPVGFESGHFQMPK